MLGNPFQSIEEILEFLQNPLKPGLVEKTDIPKEIIPPVDVPSENDDDALLLPIPASSKNKWGKKRYWMIASFIIVGTLILFISQG